MANKAMPQDDGWNWPFLLYVATVILRRSEKQFWRMTPRKLHALVGVHAEINSPDSSGKADAATGGNSKPTGFIDQVI